MVRGHVIPDQAPITSRACGRAPLPIYHAVVPQRTNLFQQVVRIIHEHLAGDGVLVEESAMLTNRLTGKNREVDVVLRSTAAGHEFVIGVEAASRQPNPISVEWVEQMIAKHANLPTDKVVLVSESGFTTQARDLAIKEYMVPLAPEALREGDPAFPIVDALRSLWPKHVDVSPQSLRMWVDYPGEGVMWGSPSWDVEVIADDGSSFTLLSLVGALLGTPDLWGQLREELNLANITEDFETQIAIGTGPNWALEVGGKRHTLFVSRDDGENTELQRIDAIEFTSKITIKVSEEIPLHHRRLAEIDVNYAFGEGSISGTPALIVATEGKHGSYRVTTRLNPDPSASNESLKRTHRGSNKYH